MKEEDAYRELLIGLTRAQKIAASGNRFGGFVWAVMAVDIYLGRRHAPPQARGILGTLRNVLTDARLKIERGSKAGGLKTIGETQQMALASAIVTELMRRRTEGDAAITKVAAAAKIDQNKLRNFRDNINRGLKNTVALNFYDLYRNEFAKAKTTESIMLELLKHPH